LVLCLALFLLGAGHVDQPQANAAANKIDLGRIGPQTGTALPPFALPDQRGETRSLRSLLGSNGAVIVFFRSADW
jgi:hypothetical protein